MVDQPDHFFVDGADADTDTGEMDQPDFIGHADADTGEILRMYKHHSYQLNLVNILITQGPRRALDLQHEACWSNGTRRPQDQDFC
jgi:hypothetical protein